MIQIVYTKKKNEYHGLIRSDDILYCMIHRFNSFTA